MAASTGFLASFALTLLAAGGVVYTGFKARRRQHLPLVALTLVLLAATIYFAEQLGHELDVQSAGVITPIHLTLAKLATLSFLLPLITGLRTLRHPSTRPVHRIAAFTALTLTVAAATTGTAMWLMAPPRDTTTTPETTPAPHAPNDSPTPLD